MNHGSIAVWLPRTQEQRNAPQVVNRTGSLISNVNSGKNLLLPPAVDKLPMSPVAAFHMPLC